MLDPKQKALLDQLVAMLSNEQRAWASGYLSGLAGGAAASASASSPLYIYYATETGNTKGVAQQLEKEAKARGFKVKSASVSRVKPEEFASLKDPAIFLSSTHGEGEPPDMAKKFFEAFLASPLSLPDLRYAVLGLGDRSYTQFCHAAVLIEEKLKTSGANAFHPTALYDVDYATHTPGWIADVLGALGPATSSAPATRAAMPATGRGYSRLEPIAGTVKESVNLNDHGSAKETYHIEITLSEPLAYEAGDAAGILMPSEPDGTTHVPRLYSIASSPALYPEEVHLTVALAKHKFEDGSEGFGHCSRYLSSLKEGDQVQMFIQRNSRFKLPQDDSKDIIMIGPGTGVAPFRAFVQERAERGGAGRSWLFFGEQHMHLDFLYQAEWQDYVGSGALTRFNAAFSRDQEQKIYVQDRLREHGQDVLSWLEGGAYLYVCGRKDPMSADVEETLLTLLTHKLGQREEAENYLALLAEEDRYVKDVY